MVDRLLEFLDRNALLKKDQFTYLAVSGGLDSIVMTDLFYKANIPFGILHCNFQLRDEESNLDQKFVEALAAKYVVQIIARKFDTELYSKTAGVSIQLAAREQRYQWFEEILRKNSNSVIATAHHKNDTAETMLYNLAKGTGLAGLHGIQSNLDMGIYRPMLFATREQIEDYADSQNLEWREDSSNKSDKYSRNHIRLNVIPELQKLNPDVVNTLSESANIFRGAEKLLEEKIEELKSDLTHWSQNSLWIEREKLSITVAPEYVLFEIIHPFGFNNTQVTDILKSDQTGAIFESNTHRLNIDRTYLIVSAINVSVKSERLDRNVTNLEINDRVISTHQIDNGDLNWGEQNVGYFDLDTLAFPLQIRTWKQGDKFVPLGMKGTKMVSDLLIDKKVPVNLKSNVLVITSGDSIIWVVGIQIAEQFKVTDSTKKVYRIKVEDKK